MKKTLAIYLFTIFICLGFLSSCSDDDPVSNNPTTYIVTSVDGNISGMNSSVRNLRAVVLKDTTFYTVNTQTIGSNNTMSISLPAPASNQLIDIDNLFLNLTGNTVVISDHDAFVNFLSFHMQDSAGILRGFLNKDNRTVVPINQAGFIRLVLIYSERNVTLSGNTTRIFNNDTTIANYNTAFGVGWNVVTQKVTVARTNHIESEFTSGEIAGMNWYYEDL